ncbi:MAG: hypothetical protein PXX83_02720 [Candidatus Nitrosotalea sp.]|nr:hypothetical protein [Candidatus Nitrosotalea sp.]
MTLKPKESKNLDPSQIKDDLFLQSVKQIMDENPRLYSKLVKL